MNIEEDIFKKTKVNPTKLLAYGFKFQEDKYVYSKSLKAGNFRVDLIITKDGLVTSKLFDLDLNEEYFNLKTSMNGSFINILREEYENILKDIRDRCFILLPFKSDQANRVAAYIYDKYQTTPEYLWQSFPEFGVFRNSSSQKWFGIIMLLDEYKLTKKTHQDIEILNVKLIPNMVEELITKNGYYKAYHMNGKYWISIALNDTLNDLDILPLIDASYQNTIKKI